MVLDGSYRVERVIGAGGFGVTYRAEDVKLKTFVALKEYYPVEFGDRHRSLEVRPKSERHEKTFHWGRTSFLQEAQMLARFRHQSIVRVVRVFEANSTAYMVMEFEDGRNFEAWLKGLGRLPTQAELDRIVAPLLDALELMHGAQFLHRDIAPDNIIVRPDGTPVLLDFGSARQAVAHMSRTLTGIVKAGFSPHEQYATDGRLQGPWSDLYSLAGTLYRAVVGRPPEEATLRMVDDHMPPATRLAPATYRRSFLHAIDACLEPRYKDRPQSVAQVRPLLLGNAADQEPTKSSRVVAPTRKVEWQHTPTTRRTGRQTNYIQLAALGAIVLALMGGAYGGYEFMRWDGSGKPPLGRALTADEQRRIGQGQEFQECSECPRMVAVPTGDFMMGSNLGDERPTRKVTITRRFAVSKFEVTFAEWDACVADGSCGSSPNDGGWGRGTRPVINVSWDDVSKGFLPWLNRKTGQRYRLLSEAEWEYAARAGSQAEFAWGNQIGVNNGNCANCGSRWDKKETAPVGLFRAEQIWAL